MLLFVLLLCVLSNFPRCQLQQGMDVTKLTISGHLKMGPVLATEGELHQTKRNTHCQWCVEGNGAGAGAPSNKDRKRTKDGAFGWGSNDIPNWSAI
jgi:hypothetical protein